MPWLFGFVHIPAQAGAALCEAALKPDQDGWRQSRGHVAPQALPLSALARQRWGDIAYWTGLGLAGAFALGAAFRVATGGTDPVETTILAGVGAALVWLTGRGLRFVIADLPRDVMR